MLLIADALLQLAPICVREPFESQFRSTCVYTVAHTEKKKYIQLLFFVFCCVWVDYRIQIKSKPDVMDHHGSCELTSHLGFLNACMCVDARVRAGVISTTIRMLNKAPTIATNDRLSWLCVQFAFRILMFTNFQCSPEIGAFFHSVLFCWLSYFAKKNWWYFEITLHHNKIHISREFYAIASDVWYRNIYTRTIQCCLKRRDIFIRSMFVRSEIHNVNNDNAAAIEWNKFVKSNCINKSNWNRCDVMWCENWNLTSTNCF